GGNHILAKRDNSAWPKGSKLSGFSSSSQFCDKKNRIVSGDSLELSLIFFKKIIRKNANE
ncbi:hypothetical protein, partial [Phocaeicola vulgatus]|uniref:hypothetical protein n=1 Tax=Phocaeicola vulgatus TaxID=821 RepID=UPI0034A5224A